MSKRSTKQTDTCKFLYKCNGSNLSISKKKLRAAKNLPIYIRKFYKKLINNFMNHKKFCTHFNLSCKDFPKFTFKEHNQIISITRSNIYNRFIYMEFLKFYMVIISTKIVN